MNFDPSNFGFDNNVDLFTALANLQRNEFTKFNGVERCNSRRRWHTKCLSLHAQLCGVFAEWRSGRTGHLPLQDEDVTTEMVRGWKRVNTLKHYHVPEGATMALTFKQSKNDYVRNVHGKWLDARCEGLKKQTILWPVLDLCNSPCKTK